MTRRQKNKKTIPTRKASRFLLKMLNGDLLTRQNVIRQLPFLLFLTGLAVAYVGYGYYNEQTVKDIHTLRKEVKALRSAYITTKSELMFKSKRSEVVEATKPLGLKESTKPPKKIVIGGKEKDRQDHWK